MNTPVKEFMTATPHTIGKDISVNKAKTMMLEFTCHHLPVLDGGKLVGVLSDRDVAIVEQTPGAMEMPVNNLMTDDPIIVDPDTSIKDAIAEMLENKVHSLIVSAKGNQPWGIFTATNALEFCIKKL